MSVGWWIVCGMVALVAIFLTLLAAYTFTSGDGDAWAAMVCLLVAVACVWAIAWRYHEETRPETFQECISKYSYPELAFDDFKQLKECAK